jgi:hypothetical protein
VPNLKSAIRYTPSFVGHFAGECVASTFAGADIVCPSALPANNTKAPNLIIPKV